jgi:phage N-6-adenine-methyltransferase
MKPRRTSLTTADQTGGQTGNFMSKPATRKSLKKRPRGRPRKYPNGSNAERCRAYRKRRKQRVYWRHESDGWSTPPDFFAALHAEFGFTLDVCAIAENAKCDRYFTPEEDVLQQEWMGVVWCNPPYSKVAQWIAKAYEASKAGATVVCLVYAAVDTRWWHTYVEPYAEFRFPKRHLKFGGSRKNAPRASAVVIFRPTGAA